jgi:hypothetical protein
MVVDNGGFMLPLPIRLHGLKFNLLNTMSFCHLPSCAVSVQIHCCRYLTRVLKKAMVVQSVKRLATDLTTEGSEFESR